MNIPVILNKPGVGQNLQDHVALGGSAYLVDRKDENDFGPGFVLTRLLTVDAVHEFLTRGTGPLYGVPECEVMAFVHTKYVRK